MYKWATSGYLFIGRTVERGWGRRGGGGGGGGGSAVTVNIIGPLVLWSSGPLGLWAFGLDHIRKYSIDILL